jgi:hypothetical protein
VPRYMALIYSDEQAWDALTDDERAAVYARYGEFMKRHGANVVDGAELQPAAAATTVRVRNDETLVTDGPYAELKEALGGYFVLECDSIEEACELAAEIPAAEHGAVEVRPVYSEAGDNAQPAAEEVSA